VAALKIDRADSDALYLLGVAQLKDGSPKLAVASLNQALLFVPTGWCEPYSQLTLAYGKLAQAPQKAYATAMDERDELRGRLEAYAIKAARVPGNDANDDLSELFRRAQEVLRAEPSDMARARALVAAHQAYLASRPPTGTTSDPTRRTT